MGEYPDYPVVPTLVSLWSAMLGGASGAVAGKLTTNVLLNGLIGFVIGGTASVLWHGMLTGLAYLVARVIFQSDISDRVLGGYKGDTLAGTFGAITGLCSAIVVTAVVPARNLQEPHAFTVCWSTATVVALTLTLTVLWRARHG